MQGTSFLFPSSIYDAPTNEYHFLDNLVQEGHLNIKSSMLDSVREMVSDKAPFYEVGSPPFLTMSPFILILFLHSYKVGLAVFYLWILLFPI
jgi:hypothetical protein